MIYIMLRRLIFFCLIIGLTCAAVQSPVSVPDVSPAYSSTAAPHDWHGLPPAFTLTPGGPGARTGKVWVLKSEAGLVIAGYVDGSAPAFPASAAELMEKDHVEIWLSAVPNPELPVIGWGNQFGDTELPKGEDSCADVGKATGQELDKEGIEQCVEWANKQKSYRVQLKRLFARQWQLAPGIGIEAFATPAYQTIEQKFTAGMKDYEVNPPKDLKPQSGVPTLQARPSAQGYDFETVIPWKLFPPVNSVSVRDLSLLVEVFSAAPPGKKMGPYSTTAPGRGYAAFAAFNRISLERPRQYTIGDCDYPVVGLDLLDMQKKGYFIPGDTAVVSDTFILENYRMGYAYEPSGLSPGTRATHLFSRQIASGEYLCGPALRIFKAGKANDFTLPEEDIGRHAIIVDREAFAVHSQPSGVLLIRNGPQVTYSKYGSGQCGACPRVRLELYALAPDLTFEPLLDIYDVIGNDFDDMDVQLSPDWTRISVFRHRSQYMAEEHKAGWEDEFYCLTQGAYKKCGAVADTPPPQPRSVVIEEEDH